MLNVVWEAEKFHQRAPLSRMEQRAAFAACTSLGSHDGIIGKPQAGEPLITQLVLHVTAWAVGHQEKSFFRLMADSMLPVSRPTKKGPRPGGLRSKSLLLHSHLDLELAAFGLREPGGLPLLVDLALYGRVKSRVGRLAARALPVSLLFHDLDHLLAVHRLFGLRQDAGCSVEDADLLPLRFGGPCP